MAKSCGNERSTFAMHQQSLACVCVFESLPVKEGGREHVHCTLSQ